MTIRTNAGDLANLWQRRRLGWLRALRDGVRRAALATERAAAKRLSGISRPWSYPVPVWTGFLRRSMFVRQPSATLAIVGNSADYARAIHTGYVPTWAGRGKHRMVQKDARPFLDDAITDADPAGIVRGAMTKALEMAV